MSNGKIRHGALGVVLVVSCLMGPLVEQVIERNYYAHRALCHARDRTRFKASVGEATLVR
jgi:hypothetical protein